MIKVNIELWPHGDETRKQYLGTIDIANDCSGTLTKGNYRYRLSQRGRPNSEWRSGKVFDFPRRRLGAYDLLLRALRLAIGERNP